MSQSCDAIQLVVVDVDELQPDTMSEVVTDVVNAGMRVGAISTRDDLGPRLIDSPFASHFDFWLTGANNVYPFDRLISLIDAEPGHILVISSNTDATNQAQAFGFRALDPRDDDISRVLV